MGCETSDTLVWADGHDNFFYSCPMRFITEDILDWYQEYEYYAEFNCAPEYSIQSCRFIDAWIAYKNYFKLYDSDRQAEHAIKTKESNNG